ncbi:hypothetical protein ACP3XK_17360, partial [Salmonella enterica]
PGSAQGAWRALFAVDAIVRHIYSFYFCLPCFMYFEILKHYQLVIERWCFNFVHFEVINYAKCVN